MFATGAAVLCRTEREFERWTESCVWSDSLEDLLRWSNVLPEGSVIVFPDGVAARQADRFVKTAESRSGR